MRFVLIPLADTHPSLREATETFETGGRTAEGRDPLARALERTVWMCELLVTYAMAIAGKPSPQ